MVAVAARAQNLRYPCRPVMGASRAKGGLPLVPRAAETLTGRRNESSVIVHAGGRREWICRARSSIATSLAGEIFSSTDVKAMGIRGASEKHAFRISLRATVPRCSKGSRRKRRNE